MFALLAANTEKEQDGWLLFAGCVCGKTEQRKKERHRSWDAEIARIYFIDRTSWWDMWCWAFLCLAGEFMAPLCCSRLKEAKHPSTHQPFTCSSSGRYPYCGTRQLHRQWFFFFGRGFRYPWHCRVSGHFWVTQKANLCVFVGREGSEL